ncbi:hypothetical protein GWI33_000868 [Rhynchophorus ferrugineus]|uniref:28S ribosomal protein S22, mitochondrial n=1 Tax=Rhynchophorus ferrugineus TaxID=354439 RepID=A0A834ISV7_RHYFE|nr:hypothetical protein GWI33_000868 [Rhynchophorus ferrugineus]
MGTVSHVLRSISSKNFFLIGSRRCLNYSAIQYDGTADPAPLFFNDEVQSLLRLLTRVDYNKVFRKRKLGKNQLSDPEYKFMTDAELKESLKEAQKKADELLQIPPVVKIDFGKQRILSKDPALNGISTSRLVFTDITFGVKDANRLIVVREPDGTLQEAEWQLKKRMNQLYFPTPGRLLKPPRMFEDNYLESLLDRQEYEFILDRACAQFDPHEEEYQRIASITYQHLNEKNSFDKLRSTRHFGSLVFFLVWNKNVDNLLLDLIETSNIFEADKLVTLYSQINSVQVDGDSDLNRVENFIKTYANKKGALELALQSYKEIVKKQKEVEQGINIAHGIPTS